MKRLTIATLSLLAMLSFLAPAFAEDDDAPGSSAYVEVTTRRVPEDPEDVPASVTIVTGEELRACGATELRGALLMIAGVDVAPGGDGGPASAVPRYGGSGSSTRSCW